MVFKVLRQLQCKFKAKEDIDLVLRNKQVTHLISLDSAIDPQDDLSNYLILLKKHFFLFILQFNLFVFRSLCKGYRL